MTVDKNQATIDFLMNCPQIAANATYFNFTKAVDNSKSIITMDNDRNLNRTFVDGSVKKRYSFTIIDFRSIVDIAIPKNAQHTNENVEELLDVQGILDWVDTQADNHNYPNFGTDCIIDEMKATTDNPRLNGIDSTTRPYLAKYTISIIIDYIDSSKRIWS